MILSNKKQYQNPSAQVRTNAQTIKLYGTPLKTQKGANVDMVPTISLTSRFGTRFSFGGSTITHHDDKIPFRRTKDDNLA